VQASGFAVNDSVQHAEWGPGVVMSVECDRLTVLFECVGYRTLSLTAIAHCEALLTAIDCA
jgi:ATP-dependent DNA helicase RecQ